MPYLERLWKIYEIVSTSNWFKQRKKLKKYYAKPSFHRVQIFNNDLVGVENKKVTVLLNKPVYVGQTILYLSKIEMYNLHYNIMKKKYGRFCSTLW